MGAIILVAMLIVPLISVHILKPEAGMGSALLLFFIVHPIVSLIIGILAGKDLKAFWITPLAVGGLFWLFSCMIYDPAFPIVYSIAYFTICSVSMGITGFIKRAR